MFTDKQKKVTQIAILALLAILSIWIWYFTVPGVALWLVIRKTKLSRAKKIIASIAVVIATIVLWGTVLPQPATPSPTTAEQNKETVVEDTPEPPAATVQAEASGTSEQEQPQTGTNAQTNDEEKIETIPATDTISAIENAINVAGDYEVTVWTMNGGFANAESNPPFEVIVNTTARQIQDCFDAKDKLFNIMKTIYGNNALKGNVARIKFTAWGQLKASLGAQDTGFDWNASGASNFWKVLQQYKPYEDELSPLNQRTYGVRINNSCE